MKADNRPDEATVGDLADAVRTLTGTLSAIGRQSIKDALTHPPEPPPEPIPGGPPPTSPTQQQPPTVTPPESQFIDVRAEIDKLGGEMNDAVKAIREQIREHLKLGGKVSTWFDDKPTPVSRVDDESHPAAAVRDPQGAPVGLGALAFGQGKSGVELHPVPQSPPAPSPSTRSPLPPESSITKSEVRETVIASVIASLPKSDVPDGSRPVKPRKSGDPVPTTPDVRPTSPTPDQTRPQYAPPQPPPDWSTLPEVPARPTPTDPRPDSGRLPHVRQPQIPENQANSSSAPTTPVPPTVTTATIREAIESVTNNQTTTHTQPANVVQPDGKVSAAVEERKDEADKAHDLLTQIRDALRALTEHQVQQGTSFVTSEHESERIRETHRERERVERERESSSVTSQAVGSYQPSSPMGQFFQRVRGITSKAKGFGRKLRGGKAATRGKATPTPKGGAAGGGGKKPPTTTTSGAAGSAGAGGEAGAAGAAGPGGTAGASGAAGASGSAGAAGAGGAAGAAGAGGEAGAAGVAGGIGAAGAIAGGAAIFAVAVVEFGKAAYQFARGQEAELRRLSEVGGSQAVAAAQIDVGRQLRDIKTANETGNSSLGLASSINQFEDALRPAEALLTNISNVLAGGILDVMTGVLQSVQPIVELLNKAYTAITGAKPPTPDIPIWTKMKAIADETTKAGEPKWPK